MMKYYADEHSIDLNALQERLRTTDMIPSHEPLLDELAEKLTSIKAAGVDSLADLRTKLKTEKSLTLLSKNTGIDGNYLKLLRRVTNAFFPKPRPLKDVDWLGTDAITSLGKAGINNTRQFFDAAFNGVADLADRTGISQNDALQIRTISDLCRVQWVSPTFARALAAAGFTNAAAVAQASPEAVFNAVAKANKDEKFYKGKIGLRDISRLVTAATYVPSD